MQDWHGIGIGFFSASSDDGTTYPKLVLCGIDTQAKANLMDPSGVVNVSCCEGVPAVGREIVKRIQSSRTKSIAAISSRVSLEPRICSFTV